MGLVFANALPVFLLIACLTWFPSRENTYLVWLHGLKVPGGVLSAAVAALSLFGVRRIIHGVVARDFFYNGSPEERSALKELHKPRWGAADWPHWVSGLVWVLFAWWSGWALARGGY